MRVRRRLISWCRASKRRVKHLICGLLAVAALSAAAGKQTFTGVITDSMGYRVPGSRVRSGVACLVPLVWLLATSSAEAQYRFEHWDTHNGLPQISVVAITQTPDGYLWMATRDGLVRFDGIRFTVFNK